MTRKRVRDGRAASDMPETAGKEIAALLARLGGRPQMAGLPGLWSSWDSQMGEELCALAWPLGHKGDILLLGCADSCAMQEARMRAQEYVRLANAWLGSDFFREARFYLKRQDIRLGDDAKARGGTREKGGTKKPKAAIKAAASGSFLAEMDPDSPVARCYARFCRAGTAKQASGLSGSRAKSL